MGSEKKVNVSWAKLAAEMAGIVFAVLLALWLEGWWAEAEQQAHADDMLERIFVEVSENREELLEAIAINTRNIETLNAYLEDKSMELKAIQSAVTISAGSTSDAAWSSAKMTQAVSRMPSEIVGDLAGLYDTQSYYADYTRFFFRQFSDLVTVMQHDEKPRLAVQKFELHLSIMNSLGQQALEKYDEYLKSKGTKGPN